jgi:hypothetical protein
MAIKKMQGEKEGVTFLTEQNEDYGPNTFDDIIEILQKESNAPTPKPASSGHKTPEPRAKTSFSKRSSYLHIPTQNVKFERFLSLVFDSKMTSTEKQKEIVNFVQALESGLNSKLLEEKRRIEREKRRMIV